MSKEDTEKIEVEEEGNNDCYLQFIAVTCVSPFVCGFYGYSDYDVSIAFEDFCLYQQKRELSFSNNV